MQPSIEIACVLRGPMRIHRVAGLAIDQLMHDESRFVLGVQPHPNIVINGVAKPCAEVRFALEYSEL
ncbi:hypothetical protein D3C87_1577940 [compost metagenome]